MTQNDFSTLLIIVCPYIEFAPFSIYDQQRCKLAADEGAVLSEAIIFPANFASASLSANTIN